MIFTVGDREQGLKTGEEERGFLASKHKTVAWLRKTLTLKHSVQAMEFVIANILVLIELIEKSFQITRK